MRCRSCLTRRLRARRHDPSTASGRQRPAAAVPAEDRRGADTRQFLRKVDDGSVRHVGSPVGVDDCRRGLEADEHHGRFSRRLPPRPSPASSSPSIRASVCGIVQDGIGYRDGAPLITLHRGLPRCADRTTRWRSPARRTADRRSPAACTATSRRRRCGDSIPRGSRSRRACTRCTTCRCRRSSRAAADPARARPT